jgi:hypothetical protein
LGAIDAHGFLAFGDPGEEFPVEFLALGAFAEGNFAVAELAAQFVAVVAGVVVDFLEAIHVGGGFEAFAVAGVFLEFVEVANEGGGVFGDADLAVGFEAVDVEDVDEEDGVVGDDGAAGLGDDVGVGDAGFTGDFGDGFESIRTDAYIIALHFKFCFIHSGEHLVVFDEKNFYFSPQIYKVLLNEQLRYFEYMKNILIKK